MVNKWAQVQPGLVLHKLRVYSSPRQPIKHLIWPSLCTSVPWRSMVVTIIRRFPLKPHVTCRGTSELSMVLNSGQAWVCSTLVSYSELLEPASWTLKNWCTESYNSTSTGLYDCVALPRVYCHDFSEKWGAPLNCTCHMTTHKNNANSDVLYPPTQRRGHMHMPMCTHTQMYNDGGQGLVAQHNSQWA